MENLVKALIWRMMKNRQRKNLIEDETARRFCPTCHTTVNQSMSFL